MTPNRDFLKRLVSEQVLTENQCHDLLQTFRDNLIQIQILLHLVQRDPPQRNRLGRFWGDRLGVAYVDLSKTIVQYDLAQKLPESFARRRHAIPLYEFGGALTVAAAAPVDRTLRAGAISGAGFHGFTRG